MSTDPEVIGAVSSAVAATAAAVAVWTTWRQARIARARERFMRWCEEPSRKALKAFHEHVVPKLKGMVVRNPSRQLYQKQSDLVQSCVRQLERSLLYAAISANGNRMDTALEKACQELEDGLLQRLEEYAVGKADELTVDAQVRQSHAQIVGVIRAEERYVGSAWARWMRSWRLGGRRMLRKVTGGSRRRR